MVVRLWQNNIFERGNAERGHGMDNKNKGPFLSGEKGGRLLRDSSSGEPWDYSSASCRTLSWAGRLMRAKKPSNASPHLTKVKHFLCLSLPVSLSPREICLGRGEKKKKVRWNVKSRVIAVEREILINSLSTSSCSPPCARMNLSSLPPRFASEDAAPAHKANKRTDGWNVCKGQKINISAVNDRSSLGGWRPPAELSLQDWIGSTSRCRNTDIN